MLLDAITLAQMITKIGGTGVTDLRFQVLQESGQQYNSRPIDLQYYIKIYRYLHLNTASQYFYIREPSAHYEHFYDFRLKDFS